MGNTFDNPGLEMIRDTALQLRSEFVNGEYDEAYVLDLVMKRYRRGNNKRDIKFRQALGNCLLTKFPQDCCDIASIALQDRLGVGDLVFGVFYTRPGNYSTHVFLQCGENIADITADQFGGPEVYVGPLMLPWREHPYTQNIFRISQRGCYPEPALEF